jgi:TolB-like protein/tetratricopeptide (TPR) repeat protein
VDGPTATPGVIRFGPFELDVASRELRKGDVRLRLQDQPFEILRMMLERPGEVVTREELRQRLWPKGTFVDFEHSLNTAVKRLRAALGDDADRPRFVETLPRRGYRFIAALADRDPSEVETGTRPTIVRLAVLPFASLSEDRSQEFFSDGLTEELIAQLGRVCRDRIAVIANRSSMVFKGTSQPVRDIAQSLRADYLLEGSVRRDRMRVRITVRLIEAATETELWADTHDRTIDDWLSVQADVATHVAQSLMVELTQLPQAFVPNHRAQELYLKARSLWALPGGEGLGEGLRCLDEAVRIEPGFAAGHGLLARLHIDAAERYRSVPRHALDAARDAAVRAIAQDAGNGDARVALADVFRLANFDWSRARRLYRDVLASNPSTEVAYRGYAVVRTLQGKHDLAIKAADLARELDPLSITSTVAVAWTRYLAGRHNEVIEVCGRTLATAPTHVPVVRLLALARAELGDGDTAVIELERAIAQVGPDPSLVSTLGHLYGSLGRQAEAIAQLTALQRFERDRYVSRYLLALVHLGIGRIDDAFDALDRALIDRDPLVAHVGLDPRCAPLRTDFRFVRLLDAMSLRRAASSLQSDDEASR